MNNSLSEIQADIQRLANQQNQIQQQHLMSQHQKQMQHQLQQLQSLSQQHLQVCTSGKHIPCVALYFSQFLLNFYFIEFWNITNESLSAQIARSPTVAVLPARPAASTEENVGSAGTRSESGQ